MFTPSRGPLLTVGIRNVAITCLHGLVSHDYGIRLPCLDAHGDRRPKVKENAPLVTDATDGLKALDSFVNEKDYLSIRSALRRPPINQLRSSSRTVILNLIDETRKAEVR